MKAFLTFFTLLLFSGQTIYAKEYIVGVEHLDYLPQYGFDSNKRYDGLGIEVLRQFSKSNDDIDFKFTPYPIKRLHQNLLLDEIDFKYPDSVHWNMSAKKKYDVIYSDNLVPYTDGILVLPKNNGRSYSDKFRVGIPLGFTPVALLNSSSNYKLQVIKKMKISELIKLANLGRVDGIYINIDVGLHRLNQLGKSGTLVFDNNLPHINDYYQLSTINHQGIINKLNQFIRSHPHLLSKLQAKYGIKPIK